MERESRILEFKREATDLRQLAKTAVSFANGEGGQILIGIDDKTRNVIGLAPEVIEELLERLPISLADQIQPTLIPQIYERIIEGKEVLVIQVFPGSQKPYFIGSEGIEKGVYVRIGAHTRRAEGEILEELRLQRLHTSYDEAPIITCPLEQLDLKLLPTALRSKNLLRSLDIFMVDPHSGVEHPTRGAVLMLHKTPEHFVPEAMIIASKILGNSGRETIESVDIYGPLPYQAESALDVVNRWLGRSFKLKGAKYLPTSTVIPAVALREAINNALFHRQYSVPGPIKIALYNDRLEIFSPGHFAGPFIPEEIGDGASYIRNKVICILARRMGLIEKRGTGIKLIQESMEKAGLPPPVFTEGAQWFKVILYTSPSKTTVQEESILDSIMNLLTKQNEIKRIDVMGAFNISKATASKHLKALVESGKIAQIGKGPTTKYKRIL